jgi:type II secretory pathway pseudopilin PulG
MHSWRGFGVLELLLVLALLGMLSMVLMRFAQHAQTTTVSWSLMQPIASSRLQLQLLRLQAQQRQLLLSQQ